MTDFFELTDEWGNSLYIRRSEIEAVRALVQGNGEQDRATLFLKSGATFALLTKFETVVDLLKTD